MQAGLEIGVGQLRQWPELRLPCRADHGINLTKRLIALFVTMVGALLAASILHADSGALIAGVAVATAYAALGFALLVRLQEAYQSIETDDVDGADLSDEPPEPRA